MKKTKANNPPTIIGGSGGSGTRVVAEILIRSGIYLGQDLNESNDNLLFTYLFKHPSRFSENPSKSDSRLNQLFELHEKILLGYRPDKIDDFKLLWKAAKDHIYILHRYKWSWVFKRMFNMVMSKRVNPTFWGWKEPHTGYFLNAIHHYYPNAKYILVMRNGLDMAYSKNTQQLKYWSKWCQTDPNDLSPRNKFEYWYEYNKLIIEKAGELFGNNFLIIKLEDLCLKNVSYVKKIVKFIGMQNKKISTDIINLPNLPESYNRFLNYKNDWIDDEVKSKLAEIGYYVNI